MLNKLAFDPNWLTKPLVIAGHTVISAGKLAACVRILTGAVTAAGAGYAMQRITAPTKADIKLEQQKMLNARTGNAADKVESRLLGQYNKYLASADGTNERSMRI